MSGGADHAGFLRALDPATRNQLTERRDGPGLVHLALHWGLIGGLGGWIGAGLPYWQWLLLPQGILLIFQFSLLHEAVHGTAFRSGWLNAVAARVAGFVVFVPATWFRYFHFAHHRFTQDPQRDPELATAKPDTLPGYLWHVSGLPAWVGNGRTLLANARGRGVADFIPQKAARRVTREARLVLAAYAVVFGGAAYAGLLAGLFWVWLVPVLLGQPFLRLFLLAEHGRCPLVADMLQNTRTTFSNRIVRYLAWNMPYHIEHHTYPTVPFHRLPELHALMRAHLGCTARGYAAFNAEYVAGLESV